MSAENSQKPHGDMPPALLTLALIREHYLPVRPRTMFRLISAGKFPKADIGIGAKLRLWKRETVESWISSHGEHPSPE